MGDALAFSIVLRLETQDTNEGKKQKLIKHTTGHVFWTNQIQNAKVSSSPEFLIGLEYSRYVVEKEEND